MARRGPITDQSGTYYEVTDDATGKARKEYVNTNAAAATTQISPDGFVVQPASLTGDQALVTAPVAAPNATGGVPGGNVSGPIDQSGIRQAGAAAPPQPVRQPIFGPSLNVGGGADYGAGQDQSFGSRYQQAPAAASPGPDLGSRIGGRVAGPLYGLGDQIRQGAGAAPRADGYYRPSISSDAGWAGQNSVGVFQGSRIDNGNIQTATAQRGRPYESDFARLQNRNGYNPPSDHGSHTSPRYDALRAKGDAMRGKIKGMANNLRYGGGGSSGGSAAPSSGYSSASYATPHQPSQNKINHAWDTYNDRLDDPMKVHGILKRAGVNKEMAMGILSDPQRMLPHLGKTLDPNDPADQELFNLPVTDMAMIMHGTQRRGLTSKNPVAKMPHVLKAMGTQKIKPQEKRGLDPSDVANQIASTYRDFMGGGALPTSDAMLGRLANTRKNSGLAKQLSLEAQTSPSQAINSVNRYMESAVLGGRPVDSYTNALREGMPMIMANQGLGLLGRKPQRIAKGIRQTARGLLG
jgi:hypothetical protein